MKHTVSPLILYLRVLGYVFLFLALCRIGFWIFISSGLDDPLGRDAWKAFYIGLRFDGRLAALVALPLGVLLCLPPLAVRLRSWAVPISLFYGLVFLGLVTVYMADVGFYSYLGNRISSLVIELLEDAREATEMVSQSYPVIWLTISGLVATAILTFLFYKIIRAPVHIVPGKGRRFVGFLFGFLVFALAVYGQLNSSLFPLRWSYAYFTTDEAIIALGLNPVQNIYDTYGASSGTYSLEKTRLAYPRMAEFLLVDRPDPDRLDYSRTFPGRAESTRPNVVIIIMESLAFPKSSFAPGEAESTPLLVSLAEESALFTNFYANARTTARGVFSTMTGVPDVNQGSTASRNPRAVDQRVVGNEFDGYQRFYLIGGNTSWANIRAVLAQNIDNLNILEENYWKAPRADVWGVSDYDLLQEAHQLFDSLDSRTPFLAIIQTASFHKPFTVPETPGFRVDVPSKEVLDYQGFESEAEYVSMRYSEYAVAEFIRLAKESAYYENTVFFIFGDHGIKDVTPNMPGGYVASNLAPWHVPLIIHASPAMDLVQPGVYTMACSQVDVFPTAAGLAGIPYTNHTLGRDIFDPRYDRNRVAYIGGKENEPVRLVRDDLCFYASAGLNAPDKDGQMGKTYLFRLNDPEGEDLSANFPQIFEDLSRLAGDLDTTARYMLFNNRKDQR